MWADISQLPAPTRELFFIHTNAKTILLLFLAGVSERLAEGPPLFSEIIAAVGNINTPYKFRLIALQPPRESDMNNENGGDDQDDGLKEWNESANSRDSAWALLSLFG